MDALILLKVCRRICHCKIQVKIDISNYPQKFGWVMALFRHSFCWCWYWFPLNYFCRDTWILLKVCRWIYHCKIQVKFDISNHPQNVGQVMALFDLVFVVGVKYKVKILFPLNNFWKDALISFEVCSEVLPLGIGAIIRTSVFFPFHIKWLALKAGDTSDSGNSSNNTFLFHITMHRKGRIRFCTNTKSSSL